MASLAGHFVAPDQSTSHLNSPPFSYTAVDFTPPSFTKLKVRPAAHAVDSHYIKKLEKAIQLMKELPGDDPRNFYQQADVHSAYAQVVVDGGKEVTVQVNNSWFFLPWHRMYLYFYERILGKLLSDEEGDFAIPFWNWDHPDAMNLPGLYTNTRSPLDNPRRNPRHDLPPTTLIVDYSGTHPDYQVTQQQIRDNLATMHRTMITNGKTAELFMGDRFVLGAKPNPGAGSLELFQHNNIRVLNGNTANRYGEDIGNFYSSGRDVSFYGLHANVDRMWHVWNKTLGHQNFDDEEWLNAAFYFYDENKQLVKVKVSDALDSEKLGYTYETRELPWLNAAPARKTFKTADQITELAAKMVEEFPLILSTTVSTVVKRPKKSRSDKEKAAEEEVLVIKDIERESSVFARFDVFVNAAHASELIPSAAEYAGSFSNTPHKKEGTKGIRPIGTNLRLGLTDLVADGDDNIVVTVVPREGVGKIKIGGVGISYIKIR